MVILLMAVGANGLIGNKSTKYNLPWNCAADMKEFKALTMRTGIPLFAGYRTFESVGTLPGRDLRVLPKPEEGGKELLSPYAGVDNDDCFLIGGGATAELYVDQIDAVCITYIPERYHHAARNKDDDVYLGPAVMSLVGGAIDVDHELNEVPKRYIMGVDRANDDVMRSSYAFMLM